MAIKKRNKTSAEFSMASLTDVIFLLLIFFMLNSKVAGVQAFKLPKSDSKTVAPTTIVVTIRNTGEHKVGNQEVSKAALERIIREEVRQLKPEDLTELTVTIVAEVGTAFDYVADVMEIAAKMKAKAIIATEPNS